MLNKQIAKIKRRPDAKSKSASQIRDEAYEELVSDALSEMLVDGSVVNVLAEIKQKDKKLWQKIKEAVQDLLKRWGEILGVYEGRTLESEEAKVLKGMEDTFKQLQEMFADAFADANATFEAIGETKNTTTEGDVKLQARELQRKDPTKLKEEELTSLLEYTKDKILSDDTYIPVRINTPQILIAFAKEFGYTLENHPLAMQVYKARQALSNEENWDGDYRDKPHDLSLEEMIGIIRAMNNPSHLVFQTENERFAEIVKFEKEGSKTKAYAIVDFSDVNKNPDLMNGYKGGKYNILVTVYPSENSTDLKKYLSNKNHKVLTIEQMKKKGISQGSYGGNTPSLLNDSPFFVDSISQTSQKSQIKLSDRDNLEQRYKELQDEYNSLNKEIEEIKNSERDFPIDTNVEATVKKAYINPKGKMHELSNITSEQNKAINRLVNQTNNDLYRGKYEGGKHRFSDTAIRHIISEHGDFLREGLRAQLPMTLTDIARHLSATKANKKPRDIKATRTRRGNPSIVTSYEVNGYTLYAEEIKKPLGENLPNDLIGHTMYKAPTLPTAAVLATSARTLPKRQSMVLCEYNTQNNTNLSRANFVADEYEKIVTVVLLLTPASKKGNQLDVIKLSSAQSRGHIEGLFKNENGSKVSVRYVDEKRIQNWLNVNRLRLPLHSFNLDSTDSISQTSKESQIKLSGRDSATTTRSILANALESVAQNEKDLCPYNKIADESPKSNNSSTKLTNSSANDSIS